MAFTAWEDITLLRFIELCSVPMPEKFLKLLNVLNDQAEYDKVFDTVTMEDNVKVFPEYFGKVIGILSEIPADLLELIDSEQRTAIYYSLFHAIALSTVHNYPFVKEHSEIGFYQPEKREYFTYMGIDYYFPKTFRISEIEIPMANEPIVTFTEASDIMAAWSTMAEKGAENVSLIAAIYCRRKDEKYSQDVAIARARMFTELSMDIYWSLFFCMERLIRRLMNAIPQHLETLVTRKTNRLQVNPGLTILEVGD